MFPGSHECILVDPRTFGLVINFKKCDLFVISVIVNFNCTIWANTATWWTMDGLEHIGKNGDRL